jgi:hypothetical protein
MNSYTDLGILNVLMLIRVIRHLSQHRRIGGRSQNSSWHGSRSPTNVKFASAQDYSTNETNTVVMLLRGPFVTPQLLTTNSAATLTSSSLSSPTHGAGNTILTLTGSNLLPGVAVKWNGSYRTTTRVDATHVTVAIPASDLASSGTGSLVVQSERVKFKCAANHDSLGGCCI